MYMLILWSDLGKIFTECSDVEIVDAPGFFSGLALLLSPSTPIMLSVLSLSVVIFEDLYFTR